MYISIPYLVVVCGWTPVKSSGLLLGAGGILFSFTESTPVAGTERNLALSGLPDWLSDLSPSQVTLDFLSWFPHP